MLSEAEQRVALLAISLFRVEPKRVQETVRAFLHAKSQGQSADLIETFIRNRILSESQVFQLKQDLEKTQYDLGLGDASDASKPTATPLPPIPLSMRGAGDPESLGRYRVLRRLGEGGMGSVYLAFDKKNNEQVALKVLSPERALVPSSLDRFHREGLNGTLLKHPHIVRAYDADRDAKSGLHYLVLEYIDGPSAHELLERFGVLPIGVATHIIRDITRALSHAHGHSIIHRDIKPGNILIASSGLAKLSDLGLAKKLDDNSNLTSARQGVGTPYYVPYEQALNAKRADERSDIYALGATFYHLVTGEVPYPGESSLEILERQSTGKYPPAQSRNLKVPDILENILARMMAFVPDDRYRTAGEVLGELEKSGLLAPISAVQEMIRTYQQTPSTSVLPQQPTSLDLQIPIKIQSECKVPTKPSTPIESPWYLRYHDRHGNLCEAVVTLAEIAKRLQSDQIAATHVHVSRTPRKGFQPLLQDDELRMALTDYFKEHGKAEVTARIYQPDTPSRLLWYVLLGGAIFFAMFAGLLGWLMS